MKRFHQLAALALCAAVALPLAPAARAEDLLPALQPYPGYADVTENDWFSPHAKLCFETGLMTGVGANFEPYRTLTVAECATVAARMHHLLQGGDGNIASAPGQEWWEGATGYLEPVATGMGFSEAAQILYYPQDPATRQDLVYLLGLSCGIVDRRELYPDLNSIEALPDSDDGLVLDFYNIGILTGVDGYGTFAGDRTLTRAECAAMVSRVIRPELRASFTPADYTPFKAAGIAPDALLAPGVAAKDYLPRVMERIAQAEARCAQEGTEFNWLSPSGLTDSRGAPIPLIKAVKEGALTDCGGDLKAVTSIYTHVFDPQVFYARYLELTGTLLGV